MVEADLMLTYNLDTLVKIYNDWGERKEQKNIFPLGSADEMLWRENVTMSQQKWLRSFIVVWESAEKKT
jgi:hypothetical protein